jgi:RNA methyltransferase, TrmH family
MEKTFDRLRTISSRQNTLVKELRQAFARAEPTADGCIAAEGFHIVEEALRSGLRPKAVFFSQSAQNRAERLLPQLGAKVEALVLPDRVFATVVDTEHPQGVAALIKLKVHSIEEMVSGQDPMILVCAGLQDPGNLGTIIRSAEAFGASGVLLSEGTVSPFNAKVVRAAAGSLFRLPVLKMEAGSAIEKLRSAGARLVATTARGGKQIAEADLRGKLAVFIGNEGGGLDRELARQMDEVVTVPHSPKVESLNAAMAASVVLYEAARQRTLSPLRHRGTEK